MNTHDDERLPGDDELAALYRKLPERQPSAALDAAVLRAAAAALRPAQPKRPRWPLAVGSAATIALAAGLAWHLRELPETTRSPLPPSLSSSSPSADAMPATTPGAAATANPPSQFAPPPPPPPPPLIVSAKLRPPHAVEAEPSSSSERPMAARSAVAPEAKAAAPGRRVETQTFDRKAYAPSKAVAEAPRAQTAPAPFANQLTQTSRPAPTPMPAPPPPPAPAPAPPAPPAPMLESTAAMPPSAAPSGGLAEAPASAPIAPVPTQAQAPVLEQTMSTAAAPAAPRQPQRYAMPAAPAPMMAAPAAPPMPAPAADAALPPSGQTLDAELAHIRALLTQGHHDEAQQRLEAFHRRHPAYVLPDDLRALLPSP